MHREQLSIPAAVAPAPAAAMRSPHWRALLEARWQARLQEIIELSLAYHAAGAPDGSGAASEREMERLLRRTVAARRKLADVEEALARLAAGAFGRCEQCGAAIPAGLLTGRTGDPVLSGLRRTGHPAAVLRSRVPPGGAMTWAWVATLALFAALIAVDLIATRKPGRDGMRAAAMLTGLWVAAGLAFGGFLWLWRGQATAGEYFASYLLEKALSIDNIFVFVLLFASLAVPATLQRRVLYLGVVGALVFRGGFIAAGGALIEHLSWIFYAFGALVLLAGARMFRAGDAVAPRENLVVRGLRRVLPISNGYDGGRFLTRAGGQVIATPLLVALVAIEVTDVVFALDSIPAVFGVTRDLFIVFTSNAFAVLGLRALYFLLAGSIERLCYLRQGLAVLLAFIGTKMLLSPFIHLPVTLSLAVIAVVVGTAVTASLWRDRAETRRIDRIDRPNEPVRE